MKADDFGCFYAEPRRLRSACYPLKDSIRDTDITRWLLECEKAGLVRCYVATEGRYLCIPNFKQRLRVMKRRFPKPPENICPSDDGHVTAPFVSDSVSLVQEEGGLGEEERKTIVAATLAQSVTANALEDLAQGGRRREAFLKPTLDEMKLHAAKIGLPESEAEKCFHYYESNGWRVGKNPMKSWQSAMINWRKNWQERGGTNLTNGSSKPGLRPHEIKIVIEAKERQAAELKRKHCSDVAMGDSWHNKDAHQQFINIKQEIKKLNGQLAAFGAAQAMQ